MTVGSRVKQCLATIKQIEATLEQLSVKTQSDDARYAFNEATELIGKTKNALQSQLNVIINKEEQYKE